MSLPEATINTDRECDECGYNLKGLSPGGKCPECGSSIRRTATRTSGFMSDEAPTRLIRKLRIGFILAAIAGLGSIAAGTMTLLMAMILGEIKPTFVLIILLSSFLWFPGILIITTRRPKHGSIRADKVLDNDRLRLLVRAVSISWPIYTISALGLLMTANASSPSTVLLWVLGFINVTSGVCAWIGLIPTNIYIAELAYWSSHDNIANRLRATAWALAVFGTISAVIFGLALSQSVYMAMFVMIPLSLVILFTLFVFVVSIAQLGSVMTWLIKHQKLAAGSAQRMRERMERESKTPGVIITGLICRGCRYPLDGLPHGGCCPECGLSYADMTPIPVRDPAKTPAYHDNTPIDIDEEGESKGVYFNDQLDAHGKPKSGGVPYKPAIQVPDDGEIPLASDEEQSEAPAQKSRSDDQNRDDSRDIDGIEPISLA